MSENRLPRGTFGPRAGSVYFAVCHALYRLPSVVQASTKLLLAAACNDLHSFKGRLCGGGCRGCLLDDNGFR
jgi:hypothetical protein